MAKLDILPRELLHMIIGSLHVQDAYSFCMSNKQMFLNSSKSDFGYEIKDVYVACDKVFLQGGKRSNVFGKPTLFIVKDLKEMMYLPKYTKGIHFEFSNCLDNTIAETIKFPLDLTHLTFGNNFNDIVNLAHCKSLTHLTFGNSFNQSVENITFPVDGSLTHLTFGFYFNKPIDNLILPTTLTHLSFGDFFDQRVDKLMLPNSLIHLEFGYYFDQPIDQLKLPCGGSFTHLIFGDFFNHPLDTLEIPNSLIHVEVGLFYSHLTERHARIVSQSSHLISLRGK